jgi:hypothetical protein
MLTTLCVEYGGEMTIDASFFANSTTGRIFTYTMHQGEMLITLADQFWFWSDEWQEGEQRVDEYILEGNVQEFDTMEEFLQTLTEQ